MNLAAKYATQKTKKSSIFHTSGYAKVQSGKRLGTTSSTTSFSERQSVEAQRKFVQRYRNSRILQGTYGPERAKTYVPRAERTTSAVRGRGSLSSTSSSAARPTSATPPTISAPAITSPPARRLSPLPRPKV